MFLAEFFCYLFYIFAVITVFAMNNMHRVEMGLIVGRGVHVRLFFLLLTAFLVGCFTAMLANLYISTKSGRRKKTTEDTERESDDFFSD